MRIPEAQDHGECGCDEGTSHSRLISIDDALLLITENVRPVPEAEQVTLQDGKGRVLAYPLFSLSDMPRFDHAAMDGYALNTGDVTGAGPWLLPVSMRCAAGVANIKPLEKGTAARIFTGAPIPCGADAVVMKERVVDEYDEICVLSLPQPGENIRLRGEEFIKGAKTVEANTAVSVTTIAAAAACGYSSLRVYRKVRVAVLVSGSEVDPAGQVGLGNAKIWDVNTPMLRAALSRPDVELVAVKTLVDDPDMIASALCTMAEIADLVVTTGGVSVGDEDHLKQVVHRIGGLKYFSGVSAKPGKPVTFGRLGRSYWLGLPGNPQSAFVMWALFGSLILDRLGGLAAGRHRRRQVRLLHSVDRWPGRCEIRAARIAGHDSSGQERVDCRRPVQSGQMCALSASDGLVFLDGPASHLPSDAVVEFLPFSDL